MNDFSLKKTRKIVVASIVWIVLSFIIADTYGWQGGDTYGQYGFDNGDFDFYDIDWVIFILCATPVGIYWAYDWIKKGR